MHVFPVTLITYVRVDDVGRALRLDTGDFLHKSPRYCLRCCICLVQNVSICASSRHRVTDQSLCRGGMIAPVLGGMLFMIDLAFPVYTSIVVFGLSGACVLLLREDAGASQGGGRAALVH